MEDIILKADNIGKKYGNRIILENIYFDVHKGEFLSILGSSGCGKTTLLRILVGIEQPTYGHIYKNGEDVTTKTPFERNIGIVFQNYALFPNMSVYENISYALKVRKFGKKEIKAKVDEIIQLVGLSDHVNKRPSQLSGGQQQRVAIARTLVLNPDIILFDEPMSALDANIKVLLRKELKKIQKTYNITMIYVTHDQEEAFSLSDKIMLIDDNKIVQMDTPANIYHNPKNDFVKSFIVNQLDEKIKSIEDSINGSNS
ncbi:MAG: ABC transporter ATP-binding protein [Anaeroplasma sp.]